MGRPPCCEKIGIKKGPWTPEEDIILVSYIQQHGPGNWRSVPTNTGLMRCSKSCRLRWTNYLRPGIRRGNFTDQEEKMIIHLQALLGNRWAAISSYLPERTDNDIKNYWNTHLKKKMKKAQTGSDDDDDVVRRLHDNKKEGHPPSSSSTSSSQHPKGQWERRLQTDIQLAKQALCEALSFDKKPQRSPNSFVSLFPHNNSLHHHHHHHHEVVPPYAAIKPTNHSSLSLSATYASSAENIARLLENWMKNKKSPNSSPENQTNSLISNNMGSSSSEGGAFESLLSFNSSISFNSDIDENNNIINNNNLAIDQGGAFQDETKPNLLEAQQQVPLTMMLENWLFDDGGAHDHQYHDEEDPMMNMSLEESTSGLF